MNPIEANLDFTLEDDENLEDFIRSMRETDRLARQHRSLPQWLVLPVELLLSFMFRIVIVSLYKRNHRHTDQLDQYLDGLEDSPFINIERCKPGNAVLRQFFNTIRNRIQYHMAPNTLKIKRVDAA